MGLLTLLGVAYFLHAQEALTGNLWGMPVDDAYIHFRFAQNLAAGHGFSFNPDQPVAGSTSPLWAVLLAVAARCGIALPLAAKTCGVLFLVATALLAWRLARRVLPVPGAAWAVGALVALDGRLLWAAPSGMEVTLFAALSLAAIMARLALPAAGSRTTRYVLLLAAICGLASLGRPEGYLLAALIGVDVTWRDRPPLKSLACGVLLYLALVAPYAVFALLTSGHPLPTTFYAKSSALGVETLPRALNYLIALAYTLVQGNPALLLAPVGAWVLWRAGGVARLLVMWPLLLILEQAVLSPVLYHFGRYVMPLDPLFALWSVAAITPLLARGWRSGLLGAPASSRQPLSLLEAGAPSLGLAQTLCRRDAGAPRGRALAIVLPILLVCGSAATLPMWADRYAQSVGNIDGMQVALGRWVRAHVPANEPVATNDVGAIGYVSGHRVVDIEGLVTPRFLALKREQPLDRRARGMLAAIRQAGARYLIAFPSVYPWLVGAPGVTPVCSVSVAHAVIVPDSVMTVYRVSSAGTGAADKAGRRPAPMYSTTATRKG